ncbi:MAG: aspartate-semialdehyde dehydrogenase [Balneolales bacterium]|nr:aspartate-semialdehyde dehydrogenase [Balneolales bacterium]
MEKLKVGVLGATGAVGQKFIRLLDNHPWFTLVAVGASERSAGKSYAEATHWIETSEMPDFVKEMTVKNCTPEAMADVDFVFSGMDAAVAGEIEKDFASNGIPVVTNARVYRRDNHVPLLVPEVNPDHIGQIPFQRFDSNGRGFIITNPNCVCVPLVLSLKPLHDAFGVDKVLVTSMQAVSGAGYPGVPSLDIMGNVVPNIGGEEEKIMWEPLKLLGSVGDNGIVSNASIAIQASAYRVPVVEGHLLSVTVGFKTKNVSAADAISVIQNWVSPIAELNLPSAPKQPLKYFEDPAHPQPRLHVWNERGMQVSVGKMRASGVLDLAFTALGHNTVRGAAGGAVLNAELLVNKGYIKARA